MNPTAYTGNDPFAFVSYARSDEARVLPLLEQLADLSIRFWYDQGGLSGSELWMGELAKRITACHVFVLCVTSGAVRSEWVVRELGFAVTQKRRILPIVIEPVEFPPEIGFLLHSVHHIQAHALAPDDLSRQLKDALKDVRPKEGMRPLERAWHDYSAAGDIQAKFFGTVPPLPPGWRIAKAQSNRFGLGGDLCVALSDGRRRLSAVALDVSGQGAPSSVVCNFLHGAVRAMWAAELPLREMVDRLNRMVVEGQISTDLHSFVTGVLCDLDAETGAATVAAAGSIFFHVQRGPTRVVQIGPTMMPLGIVEEPEIEVVSVDLGAGELLVAASDGVVEQHSDGGQMFGNDRLRDVIGLAVASDRDVVLDVTEAVREFRGATPVGDDWSIIAVCRDATGLLPPAPDVMDKA